MSCINGQSIACPNNKAFHWIEEEVNINVVSSWDVTKGKQIQLLKVEVERDIDSVPYTFAEMDYGENNILFLAWENEFFVIFLVIMMNACWNMTFMRVP